ncbi:MAG: bifunctional pyr operon transcriptional regulator/uracil phosphoribosyltransferase PyrR [Micrococcales bacterium]|nr:bifunctional pyr operon transcriptional regulator/uracil phosphoribosyltransferase PyrR [Micrococcales bacterium]
MTPDQDFLTDSDIHRAVIRIAHEILERNRGAEGLILLGIPTRGVHLAQRIAQTMSGIEGYDVPAGALDVGMYRDDLRLRPTVALHPTVIPGGDVTGETVILVDDVLFSGRTVRAAMDALNDVGRPRAVQLAVLVDRGHRDLPIRADYVGKNIPTAREDDVQVTLTETDGADAVRLVRAGVK